MKIHPFRYVLVFLILTLFVVTSLVHSEEDGTQSNGELNSPEDSSEKSPSVETQGTEPETEEQSPEPEHRSDALQGSLQSPFLIYIMIGAFIVLAFATAISLVIWDKRLQRKVDAGELLFQQKLNKTQQDWEEQLKYVNQQGKDNTQQLDAMVSNHSAVRNEQENLQNGLSELGNRLDGVELKLSNIGSDSVPDKSVDAEAIIQEAQTQVESLAQVYENGEPIDIVAIDNPTPNQNALMLLNWIARTIEDWTNELEQSGTANPNLIQTLEFANQAIKDKLKEIRGPGTAIARTT